jgi:UTP--glucose-1-phosphate uridylyltransferase
VRFAFVRQQRMLGTVTPAPGPRLIGNDPAGGLSDDLHLGIRRSRRSSSIHGGRPAARSWRPCTRWRREPTACSTSPKTGPRQGDRGEAPPGRGTQPRGLHRRYLYTPEFFRYLERGLERHEGGEYFHIYALNKSWRREGVYKRLSGTRLDTGKPEGYLDAILRYAVTVPSRRAVVDDSSPPRLVPALSGRSPASLRRRKTHGAPAVDRRRARRKRQTSQGSTSRAFMRQDRLEPT